MIVFVSFALGNKIMRRKKGWGAKVATEKSEWMGSGETAVGAAAATALAVVARLPPTPWSATKRPRTVDGSSSKPRHVDLEL
jgi:membrane-associated phospholipid phosphatase